MKDFVSFGLGDFCRRGSRRCTSSLRRDRDLLRKKADARFSTKVRLCFAVALIAIFSFVFVRESIGYDSIDGAPCEPCRVTYSLYKGFLCFHIVALSSMQTASASDNFALRKAMSEFRGRIRRSSTSSTAKFPVALLVFEVATVAAKIFADYRLDPEFPQLSRVANYVSFFHAFLFAIEFANASSDLEEMYRDLEKSIEPVGKGSGRRRRCWTITGTGTAATEPELRDCPTLAMELLKFQQSINDVFGKQICLIQAGVIFGSIVNGYLLVYLNLEGWSSAWLNACFCTNAIECGVIALAFGLVGHWTSDAANAMSVGITRSPTDYYRRHYFDRVKHFGMYILNEPPSLSVWTFYPLNLETFFSITLGVIAFTFVLLQFNSLHSKFDLSVF